MNFIIDSQLQWIQRALSEEVLKVIEDKGKITKEEIKSVVETSIFRAMPFSDAQLNSTIRYLESNHQVEQKTGSIIKDDVTPWLNSRKEGIDFYYWGRLKKMMIAEQTLPLHVLSRLDEITDQKLSKKI